MKTHDRVTIYEDPITQQKYEGKACLLKLVDPDAGTWDGKRLERWKVCFDGDGMICERVIMNAK